VCAGSMMPVFNQAPSCMPMQTGVCI
jgi:hypothetical protein